MDLTRTDERCSTPYVAGCAVHPRRILECSRRTTFQREWEYHRKNKYAVTVSLSGSVRSHRKLTNRESLIGGRGSSFCWFYGLPNPVLASSVSRQRSFSACSNGASKRKGSPGQPVRFQNSLSLPEPCGGRDNGRTLRSRRFWPMKPPCSHHATNSIPQL